ncbi:MAG TPA: prolyl oligopeptidase family serine peptidase [Fimbriimonas sp.]|nr:prolyl oligopeptidase family serine peptidase [Fimbriimonas sp.]
MALLFACLPALQPTPVALTEGLAIGNVSAGGRRPMPSDAIIDAIVAGKWKTPKEGDTITVRGSARPWRRVKADKDGWFNAGGYLFATVDEPTDTLAILNAQGDTFAYVNGEPRPGDPYGYGYLNLPVRLHRGANELLFAGGRGRIKASLTPVEKPVSVQESDATLPDVLTTDQEPLWAGVTVINAEECATDGIRIRATLSDGATLTVPAPTIQAMSARKVPFQIPTLADPQIGKTRLKVEILKGDEVLDTGRFEIQVKKPTDLQKRTFVSGIDGSVQYYAVQPAAKPSPDNALVLTLHGASVEAIGQAAAYAQKDWVSIVAPTNRRPYGFDWEDIGRLDALEVLDIAKRTIPHDPLRVDLTGHSMGGHGTWSVGTLYPNLFASIAPSAGWISFWSYAGGWNPNNGSDTENLLRRSMNVGDTLGRVDNTLAEDVYILHGDADDNVPVEQARTMRKALEGIEHPHLQYHEQPGAGHWWGNQCVDWPPIFDMVKHVKLDEDPSHVDFTTQNPAVSATLDWVTVDQQSKCLEPSHVVADKSWDSRSVHVLTNNVHELTLTGLTAESFVTIDSDTAWGRQGCLTLARKNGHWTPTELASRQKNPERSGPFKQVFNRKFVLVVGTTGTGGENQWARDRARLDSETLMYRGNGAVDIVDDKDFSPQRFSGRNVVLYGNADTNSAYQELLRHCPVKVRESRAVVGEKEIDGPAYAALLVYPNPYDDKGLVAVVGGTGLAGMRETDRLPLISSGVAYPDWIVFDPASPGSIWADGFFGNDWSLRNGETAMAK